MVADLTALKREKIDRTISTGLIQTVGADLVRKKAGTKDVSKAPTVSLGLEAYGSAKNARKDQ